MATADPTLPEASTQPATRPSAKTDPAAAPQRVTFVCDASGTMVTSQYEMKRYLKRAVEDLSPEQRFNIVLFGSTLTLYADKPVSATPEHKQDVIREGGWMDAHYHPDGKTDPLDAISAAFKQGSQAINLVTDGLESPKDRKVCEKLRARLRSLNPYRVVHVNVLLISSPNALSGNRPPANPESDARIAILKQIAVDNKGEFSILPPE
jgi:hypothetical protein